MGQAPTKRERDKRHDANRRQSQPWRRWYSTKRWLQRRAHQLQTHPLCAECAKQGIITAATVADHVIPHRGNADLFWRGELASLCATCHSSTKQREESGNAPPAIGADGWPIDPPAAQS